MKLTRSFFLTLALLFLSINVHAQPLEQPLPLPLCGIVAGIDEWNNQQGTPSLRGDTTYINRPWVAKGLWYNCASQLRMTIRWVEEEHHSYWVSNGLTTLPQGRAEPSTIHTADGDQQHIFLSVDAPGRSSFRSCYPGWSADPSSLCPEEFFGGNYELNVIITRQRNDDGSWPFSWTVEGTNTHSGIVLRRVGECANNRFGCEYEVKFALDEDGKPRISKDTQVLVQVPIYLDSIPETGDGFNSTMVIPFLVQVGEKDDPDTSPTPEPGTDDDSVSAQATTQLASIFAQLEIARQANKGLSKEEKEERGAARRLVKSELRTFASFVKDNSDTAKSMCGKRINRKLKNAKQKARDAKGSVKNWKKLKNFLTRVTGCFIDS